jgi:flagellar biosynthesis/type III secretory pathway chaperone
MVWNLENLGQNLGKILENLQQENLEIGQIFNSEAEQNLKKILKSSNISALTNALADELGIWGNLKILKLESWENL